MTDEERPDRPERWPGLSRRAAGMTDDLTESLAEQERELLRTQALDDAMFAAVLEAFGGDERTARVYWYAGRHVLGLTSGRHPITDPDEVVRLLRRWHRDWSGDERTT